MRIDHGTIEGECLIILGFHRFCLNNPESVTEIEISTFQELLTEIKKRSLMVVTLTEAIERLKK
jgi:hypothetical protein